MMRARQPRAKARDRRKRRELVDTKELPAQVLDDLLDEEMAERHASETGLAVGDGVEHRPACPGGIRDRSSKIQQRLNVAGQPASERDLDEDQRFVRKRRMKERVAAPVRRETAPQVVPSLDLMHGFVG